MTVCIDTSSVESFHVGSYEQAATFDMQVDITSQRRIKIIIWKLMDFTFNPESLFYVWVIAKLISKVCVILLTFSNYEPTTKSLPLSKKCPHSELFWSIFSPIRTAYGEIRSISPYSVWMQENVDQSISEYGHFLGSGHIGPVQRDFVSEIWYERRGAKAIPNWTSELVRNLHFIYNKWEER